MNKDFYAFLSSHGLPNVPDCWQRTRLSKIEVRPARKLWRMHVLCPEQPVPAEIIEQTVQGLLGSLPFLEHLELLPQPMDIEKTLDQILSQEQETLLAGFLAGEIYWHIENNHLDLFFNNEDGYARALESELCTRLASWFWDAYRLRVVVRARSSQNQVQEPRQAAYIPQKELTLLTASQPDPRKKKNGFRKNGSTNLEEGSLMDLAELEDGLRNALVEGEIWDKKASILRDGRQVSTYYLTDSRDSLIIKAFYDDIKQDRIQVGDYIRVRGSVRHDANLREIVLFLEAYQQVSRPVRQDDSPRKRVELHAHTKMSSMDGLTEIKELVKRAALWGHSALAITDHGCTQAFPEAYQAAKKYNMKIIYGIEAYLVEEDKRERPFHIVLLARDTVGLKNIYRLVTASYLEHYYRFPKIPRELLAQHRSGLLLGSACEAGELFQALLGGVGDRELEEIASFYDYLEVQPLGNNDFLLREGRVSSQEDLENMVRRIIELGKRLGKPVVATGDVHFLDPEHEIYRRIIQSGQGYEDAQVQAPLYFRTTEEMLAEFAFLGEEDSQALVIDHPAHLAEMVDNIKPVPDGFYPPTIDRAEEEISSLTWEQAAVLYGSPLPELVKARIERELDAITRHGFSVLYLIAQKLVKKSNQDGYLVGSRGSVGSSFVAYLTGITEVNPLTPHYVCPACSLTHFPEENAAKCGADMPEADCPACGQPMRKEGFDIPFETFLGFEGDKIPDIDLNFSGEYQNRAHQYVEELFGKENVFRAGTISTIADRTAYGFVLKFAEAKQLQLKNSEINRLVRGISGVRRTTGQHPGGLIVVPRESDIHDFTPLQHPAENKESGVITTHFEYHAIGDQLVKLDILGHDDPTVIKELEDLTGIRAAGISLSEENTMKIFSSVEPLGLKPEAIGSTVGTFGIPEFGTRFVRQMLEATRPTTFAELVRISGLSHGTDVWINNAQVLISQDVAPLNEVICTRDDIMTYLIQHGLEKKQAFKIMENVRKGKGLDGEMSECMLSGGVPSWYIDSCRKIKYMFPKAHAVAYVTMAFRIAYFKVYHPLAFYASFFSVRAEDFEVEVMLKGCDALHRRIREIEKMGNEASQKERKLLPVLEVAMEMCARGYQFWPVDIYKSEAAKFVIRDQGLLLPFSSLPNVGKNAAEGIVAARGEQTFISVEDMQARTHLNKTSLEILRQFDCLHDLPESNQIQLFGC
ncbi:MAG TPA: PolC-type DNA polymerase III [Syntrophomonadaceae bacterium]|nr:PolC-type DNA polymerase III [Syntrophomonadaceae bacterium]